MCAGKITNAYCYDCDTCMCKQHVKSGMEVISRNVGVESECRGACTGVVLQAPYPLLPEQMLSTGQNNAGTPQTPLHSVSEDIHGRHLLIAMSP